MVIAIPYLCIDDSIELDVCDACGAGWPVHRVAAGVEWDGCLCEPCLAEIRDRGTLRVGAVEIELGCQDCGCAGHLECEASDPVGCWTRCLAWATRIGCEERIERFSARLADAIEAMGPAADEGRVL